MALPSLMLLLALAVPVLLHSCSSLIVLLVVIAETLSARRTTLKRTSKFSLCTLGC
jgi:hypothetical protein